MPKTSSVDTLIVGSGMAGIATAMALKERGVAFSVLDTGYDLEETRARAVAQLSKQDVKDWPKATTEHLFPPPKASADGVERRHSFGSDFPYRLPGVLSASMENCNTELTHAIGGFGNVWGAAMLPYSDHSLRDWPIPKDELKRSYNTVLKYVPLSAENDELSKSFPIKMDNVTSLERSAQSNALLHAFERRKSKLDQIGVEFGRARIAVNSSGDATTCRYCGRCLDGCVYGSMFNPRLLWAKQEESKRFIHRGLYVREFQEHEDHVLVTAIRTDNGTVEQWRAKRLFLASGHFATTCIIARSLKRFYESIHIMDSQYFFFPLLSYIPHTPDYHFALADIFLELLNEDISPHQMHFQLYGMNQIFEKTLRKLVPRPMPLSPIANRFYLFQGFLHSAESGHLKLEVRPGRAERDEIVIRGIENPHAFPIVKRVQSLLRRTLIEFGVVPPIAPQLVPPGRSFHTGGSFPIGRAHPIYSSDLLGRPAGLRRVHIVDSANFPNIASSTIAYTIMANADRIVRACSSLR